MEQSTDLHKNLTEFLHINDDRNKYNYNNSIITDTNYEEQEEEDFEEEEEEDLTAAILAQSGYAKSDPTNYEEQDFEEEEDDLTATILAQSGYAKSDPPKPPPPLPVPCNLNPVSAMKGSREKQGIPAMDQRVKWAADVYDPQPTAGTLAPMTSTVRQRSDKKMNKQKSGAKAEAGVKGKGKGKDKKQAKKYGGSSNRCFDLLDDDDRLVDYGGGGYANFDDRF